MIWIKYGFLALLIVVLGVMVYQYNSCREKGKRSKGAFKCGLFSREPESLLPVDEYYDVSKGECFHFIDYGDRMSIKKVGMEKCSD